MFVLDHNDGSFLLLVVRLAVRIVLMLGVVVPLTALLFEGL